MSNRGDFNFDDEFDFDNDFSLGDDLPSGIGDDDDLPDLGDDSGGERQGPNRTFIILAAVMIVLFVVALGVVLVIATRPPEITPNQLTSTRVVELNQTIEAQLRQTETQSAEFANLTATADAATDTPTPTATNTRPPTVTPTGTLSATELAGTALAAQAAANQTAQALQLTNAALNPGQISIEQGFATEIAYATLAGGAQQNAFATQVAVVTAAAQLAPTDQLTAAAAGATQTQGAVEAQAGLVEPASNAVEAAFATSVAIGGPFATQALAATPAAGETQVALATPLSAATQAAVSTRAAFATQIAANEDVSGQAVFATVSALGTPPALSTAAAAATQSALLARATFVALAQIEEVVDQGGGEIIDVPGTATALALTLLPAPTQEGATPGVFAPTVTALPDTGLFDDIAGGGRLGIGMIALAAFGLVGVIAVSRWLRASNNRREDEPQP